MTVDELLDKLSRAFPAFNARSLETWAPVFRAALSKHEGPALREAFVEVLSTFQVSKAKTLYPMVSDFAARLPGNPLKLPSSGGKPIDLAGRRERMQRLMADWRMGQGARASNGVPEVMLALEFIAVPLAGIQAWNENPTPVVLKRGEVRLAQRRAISQQRRIEYGKPGDDADIWWEQIVGIAQRWGIETTREEWTAPQGQARPAPVKSQGPRPPFVPDTSPAALRTAKLAEEFRAKQDAERRPKPET